jgi:hypothetical protein
MNQSVISTIRCTSVDSESVAFCRALTEEENEASVQMQAHGIASN